MSETSPPQTPPPGPPSQQPPTRGDLFNRIRAFGIARHSRDRWIGGVAAGLGRRWNIDPLLMRGLVILFCFFGGLGVLLYGLAWALLPEEDGRIHLEQATRGDFSAGIVGAGALMLLFLISTGPDNGPWWWWGFPGPLVLIGLVFLIFWAATRGNRTRPPAGPPPPYGVPPTAGAPHQPYQPPQPYQPYQQAPPTGAPYGQPYRPYAPPYQATPPGPPVPTPPPAPIPPPRPRARASHRITRMTLGLAVLAAVVVIIVQRAVENDVDTAVVALAAALAVVAGGAIFAGFRGHKSGGLAPIGILLSIALIIAAASTATLRHGTERMSVIGERDWRPASVTDAERHYSLGAGDATLWLTDPSLSGATASDPIDSLAQVGLGTLTVVVPAGVPVEITTEIGGGDLVRPDGTIRRFDDDDNDHEEIVRTGPAGEPVIVAEARVGFGEILIKTSGAAPTATAPAAPAPTVTPAPTASGAPTATPAPGATATAPVPTGTP